MTNITEGEAPSHVCGKSYNLNPGALVHPSLMLVLTTTNLNSGTDVDETHHRESEVPWLQAKLNGNRKQEIGNRTHDREHAIAPQASYILISSNISNFRN